MRSDAPNRHDYNRRDKYYRFVDLRVPGRIRRKQEGYGLQGGDGRMIRDVSCPRNSRRLVLDLLFRDGQHGRMRDFWDVKRRIDDGRERRAQQADDDGPFERYNIGRRLWFSLCGEVDLQGEKVGVMGVIGVGELCTE